MSLTDQIFELLEEGHGPKAIAAKLGVTANNVSVLIWKRKNPNKNTMNALNWCRKNPEARKASSKRYYDKVRGSKSA